MPEDDSQSIRHTYLWFDIGYTVIFTPGMHSARAEAYRHVGRDGNRPVYESRDDLDRPTCSLDEAEPFSRGRVAWDGRSNWNWNQNGARVRFQDPREIVAMQRMMTRVHELGFSHIKVLDN